MQRLAKRSTPCTRRALAAGGRGAATRSALTRALAPQSSTREHVQRFAEGTLGMTGQARAPWAPQQLRGRRRAARVHAEPPPLPNACCAGAARAQVLAQLRYDLPASYAFHRAASKDVDVDLWRFSRPV